MNNSKTATQKHMTLDDRISIEKGLDQHLSLRSIALQLGKIPPPSPRKSKSTGLSRNTIVLMNLLTNVLWQKIAKRKYLWYLCPCLQRMCRSCNHCNSHCEDFIPRSYHCSLLDKAPFVCNGCSKRIPAASIKPTTAHPLHTGNIKPSLWNQEQVLTFRLLTLLLWMNW